MQKRRRFKQTQSLQQRLTREAQRLREEAGLLPSGPVRDAVLTKVRQLEAAAHLNDWLSNVPAEQHSNADKSSRPIAQHTIRAS